MNCEDKKSICNTCPRKADGACIAWTKVCVGMSCHIGAFENPEAMNKFKTKIKSVSVEPKMPEDAPEDLVDIFFGIKAGELPERYQDLKKSYFKDKQKLGKGCSQCKLNGLMSSYKKKIAAI